METPERLKEIELFAWLGEDDEHDSGVIGIKQGIVPAGYIPLVATMEAKVNRGAIRVVMNSLAAQTGKKRYLCRFTFSEVVLSTEDGKPIVV